MALIFILINCAITFICICVHVNAETNFLFGAVLGRQKYRGGQRKRYKDTLKQTLKMTGIDTET